jgi:hypothetical protein
MLRTKTFFIGMMLMSSIPAWGQVQFGVKGGIDLSKFNASSKQGMSINFSNRLAFHVGGLAEIPFGNIFSIQPELLFTLKGAKHNISETLYPYPFGMSLPPNNILIDRIKTMYNPCYIELPVYLRADFKAGTGKIVVGFGPYLAYGVSGKIKTKLNVMTHHLPAPLHDPYVLTTTYSGKGKMDFFKTGTIEILATAADGTTLNLGDITSGALLEDKPFKRFDAGFASFISYELKTGYFITVGLKIGLFKINKSVFENEINPYNGTNLAQYVITNKTFSLSIGYKF